MDDDKRSIFVLAEVYGETVVSIANGLGINVNTVYNRLRVARKMFRGATNDLCIRSTKRFDDRSLETY